MASFTSTPDPTPTPAPRREKLDSVAAQIAALDELVARATHSIRVFDIDLSGMGWNGAARAERIAALVRSSRRAAVEIVVHDTRWIESSCSRLVQLLRLHGHGIAVRKTGSEAAAAMDPLVIVDGRHYLHRFHADHATAALVVDDASATQPLIERFDEIWAGSEPGLSGTVLGL